MKVRTWTRTPERNRGPEPGTLARTRKPITEPGLRTRYGTGLRFRTGFQFRLQFCNRFRLPSPGFGSVTGSGSGCSSVMDSESGFQFLAGTRPSPYLHLLVTFITIYCKMSDLERNLIELNGLLTAHQHTTMSLVPTHGYKLDS